MKKQRNTFQAKEQDKTSETDLNEMEISNWPDRVQNNGHKDAQWSQENNARTSENSYKLIEKKNPIFFLNK